jgi:translation initiation factor 3 subunit J
VQQNYLVQQLSVVSPAFFYACIALTDVQGTDSKELDYLISFQPRTKDDYAEFSSKIIEYIIKRHENKPLYASFVEHHVRELCLPLKDVEVRKAASGLTTLANEKQKEQREKASGKKKPKGKPALGGTKGSSR